MKVFVAGVPRPQGSKKAFCRGGRAVLVEDSKYIADWRETMAWTVKAHTDAHSGVLLEGAVSLELEFLMPRPKSLKTDKPHTSRPDIDKLTRAVLDALTNIVMKDDSQVTFSCIQKRYARPDEQPGVWISWQVHEHTGA